jgi:diguanylate cyclase (GGDEF)-like protein
VSGEHSPGAPGRILVIDDEPTQRLLARAALESSGHEVAEAAGGENAVDLAASFRPDLVLLDVRMPLLDGFEVCRRLRRLAACRDTSILMMTGLDDIDSIERAYEAGATDFAVKPINWTILAHRVAYMLRASRASMRLRLSEAKLANSQRIARLGYWEWQPNSNRLDYSFESIQLLGLAEAADPRVVLDLYEAAHPEDREICERFVAELDGERRLAESEFRIVTPQGETRFIRQLAGITRNLVEQVVVTGAVQDVTEQRLAEERVRQLANYDVLTELPNRRCLTDELRRWLERSHDRRTRLALFFLDFDRFKMINDNLGHAGGDELLQRSAARLEAWAAELLDRGLPKPLIARFGGDEFVVVSEVGGDTCADTLARDLLDIWRRPFEVQCHEVGIRMSIGIAQYPEDGREVEILLRKGDVAMYQVKNRGGNGYCFYDESRAGGGLDRLRLELELSEAVGRNELVLFYQPIYDPQHQLFGAEALVRWQHPQRGLLTPNDFLPLAEETGLIVPIGNWVLRELCHRAVEWAARATRPIFVTVNLSARQLEQPDFELQLETHLADSGLDPKLLMFELTETLGVTRIRGVQDTLRRIAARGSVIAIDDFGTGYSAIPVLKALPVGAVKIAQEFMDGVPEDPSNAGIVRAICGIAHDLGLTVIAEGVETAEQARFLADEGCNLMQGFHLGRPMAADQLAALLETTGLVADPS